MGDFSTLFFQCFFGASKNYFFLEFLRFSGLSSLIFIDFGVIWGPCRAIISMIFQDPILEHFFVHVSAKNAKT